MLREKRYKQIVHAVEKGILDGKYSIGDRLPSINSWHISTGLSRSSIMLALQELKERGIIESDQSVGYFVSSTSVEIIHRILLIFGLPSLFKEDLCQSIIQSLGKGVTIDIMFHGANRETFDMLLDKVAGKYSIYVIIPSLPYNIESRLRRLGGKVVLADYFNKSLVGKFSSVTQDFANDTYDALVSCLPSIRRYKEITLVQSSIFEPMARLDGIKRFCSDYGFEASYLKTMEDMPINQGVIYLTPEDREIVNILASMERQRFVIGKDFGLITCNETVLKKVICGGLTTLSTDFIQMGKTVAELIWDNEIRTIHNPWRLIMRNTL